jgi:hypothetical protein
MQKCPPEREKGKVMATLQEDLLGLLKGLARHADCPDYLPPAKEILPLLALLPPRPDPQLVWVLLGLIHYRQRKVWAWDVLLEHLGKQLGRPSRAKVSIQDVRDGVQEGVVPGLPDWQYYLDGNDSHLIHRGTGEDIHLDALNGPELIPEDWFIHHFMHHRQPGPSEQRLAQLFPQGDGCRIVLDALRKTCLLHPTMEGEFTLCGKATPYSEAIEHFLARWQHPSDRLLLGAAIGDWLAAHEAALATGDAELAALTDPQARACRERWLTRLRKRVAKRGLSEDLLRALARAGAEDLPAHLEQALANPCLQNTAIEVVQDDPSWCPRIFDLFLKGPQPSAFEPFGGSARYLARHGYRVPELFNHLLADQHPRWDVLIELGLDHAPERLPDFLRRALRSLDAPYRLNAGAVLALLDTRWSRGVLTEVLDSSKSQDATCECRAALRECHDAGAGEAACRWEERHPEHRPAAYPDARFLYTLAGGLPAALRDRMSQLAEVVYLVRDQLPQE